MGVRIIASPEKRFFTQGILEKSPSISSYAQKVKVRL